MSRDLVLALRLIAKHSDCALAQYVAQDALRRDSDTRPKDGDAPKNAAPLASSAVAKPIAQSNPPSGGSSHA